MAVWEGRKTISSGMNSLCPHSIMRGKALGFRISNKTFEVVISNRVEFAIVFACLFIFFRNYTTTF